jgi:hypothetical protein
VNELKIYIPNRANRLGYLRCPGILGRLAQNDLLDSCGNFDGGGNLLMRLIYCHICTKPIGELAKGSKVAKGIEFTLAPIAQGINTRYRLDSMRCLNRLGGSEFYWESIIYGAVNIPI